jgi:hypothetical protein
MSNQPMNTDLRGTVAMVHDTGKVFESGGIRRRKYLVHLNDGSQYEYCPGEHHTVNFVAGDRIVFQIKYRNDKGETIDVSHVEGKGVVPQGPAKPLSQFSMMGHPAVVSLTVAKDMALYHNWGPEQMLAQAEVYLGWLMERRDLDSYTL